MTEKIIKFILVLLITSFLTKTIYIEKATLQEQKEEVTLHQIEKQMKKLKSGNEPDLFSGFDGFISFLENLKHLTESIFKTLKNIKFANLQKRDCNKQKKESIQMKKTINTLKTTIYMMIGSMVIFTGLILTGIEIPNLTIKAGLTEEEEIRLLTEKGWYEKIVEEPPFELRNIEKIYEAYKRK